MEGKPVNTAKRTISDIGEKALIRDFIKPFFNGADDPRGVGDDCAMVAFGEEFALLSTDRVPSDLTAFRLGILDHSGLGNYLARLNLSDLAACGASPVGLLLNLGLPDNMLYDDVVSLCRGFQSCAERFGATVLGGDITSASELSVSATSIGRVPKQDVLTRRGAVPGDSVFISRPLGMTPAAFVVFLNGLDSRVAPTTSALLKRQFTDMQPMLELGLALRSSGKCGACMDNTDGLGQSLAELADASRCSIVIDESRLSIPPTVVEISNLVGQPPLSIVFNAGADFSLVGTLRGNWSDEEALSTFNEPLQIIGSIETGDGVWIAGADRRPLQFHGWNYFRPIDSQPS